MQSDTPFESLLQTLTDCHLKQPWTNKLLLWFIP